MGIQDMVTSYVLNSFFGNVPSLIIGIALILLSVFVLRKIKNFMVNAIFGCIVLFAANFLGLGAPISLPTIVVALLFGPAGVGVILVLKFFGVSLG